IFLQHPQPIANPCVGIGERDYLWYNTSDVNYSIDTTTNKCACYPRYSVGATYADSAFFSKGIITTNDSLIAVFGLKTDNRVIGWIHNKKNYWYRLPHDAGINSNYP